MLKSELDEELKAIKRGTRQGAKKWPSKLLLNILVEVATVANSVEGIDPDWPVVTANLVGIYRSEEAKRRNVDDYVPPAETRAGPLIQDGD